MRDARFGGLACLLAFASVLLAASVRVDYPSAEVPSERTSEASVAWLQASGGSAPSVSCALQGERAAPARPLSPRSAPAFQSTSPEANAARGSNRRSRTIAPAAQKGVCRERLNAVSS